MCVLWSHFQSGFNENLFILSGLVNDLDNSWPTAISFKPNFEQGALLTIVISIDYKRMAIFVLPDANLCIKI